MSDTPQRSDTPSEGSASPPTSPDSGGLLDAAREAVWRWGDFTARTTPMGQASALVGLADAMSDLASWVPEQPDPNEEIMNEIDPLGQDGSW